MTAARMIAALLLTLPGVAVADDLPKLGPHAVPVTADHGYLQTHPAPDFWAFFPFVKPQFTSSACSVATVTAVLNGLRGLPAKAEDYVMTQTDLIELSDQPYWAVLSSEGGDGVSFAQLVDFTTTSLKALGMKSTHVGGWQPMEVNADTLSEARRWLSENERSAEDALMVYYNQGVVTGDWDGPHVALIGAYDADQDRALILEVDQDWYIPYWTPVPVLLDAMVKPAPEIHGPLAGEQGGFVRVGPDPNLAEES